MIPVDLRLGKVGFDDGLYFQATTHSLLADARIGCHLPLPRSRSSSLVFVGVNR